MSNEQFLFQNVEADVMEEKANKLFGLTRILDSRLTTDFLSFLSILDPSNLLDQDQKKEAIATLNKVLTPIADEIAAAFTGVGVGYYALCVDSIVAYAPSDQLGDKVGISIWPEHIGRRAMQERREIVGVGSMVRGDVLNTVRPLIRGNKVIGFVWANETVEDIYRQLQERKKRHYYSDKLCGPLLGMVLRE